ncbi:MAG: dihydropteroate synthase [Arenicellales bacterium]
MIFLGLGSNCGKRRAFLTRAIDELKLIGFQVAGISPVVESPALLKDDAKDDWNQPYLNLVLSGETDLLPHALLKSIKTIEQDLGRDLNAAQWSPRNIDIDILLWGEEKIQTDDLKIPHPEMHKRAFVITPLMHLAPNLVLPDINLTAFEISQRIRPMPLWMGIVNLTPDSFSDAGEHWNIKALEAQLERWIMAGVHILDFGAESTRPDADEISQAAEWSRLRPVFEVLDTLRKKHFLMPIISIDTRHVETAELAFEQRADWINDVTGLVDADMVDLIKNKKTAAIAMHSLSVPVVKGEHLPTDASVVMQLKTWLADKTERWVAQGINTGNIIFDPGVGFGKTDLQNMQIIRATADLRNQGFRLLVGHSRKSFMQSFSDASAQNRDIETVGLSLSMCAQGVDIIRVHEPLMHIRAYRAWSHAQ